MAMRPLGRNKLIAAPMMAAVMTLAVPTAAQAAGTPGAADKSVATTVEVPATGSTGVGATGRRLGRTITSLDDIRDVIA